MKRTKYTKNEIRVVGNICEMDLYNMKGEVRATTVFNKKYLSKVKKLKWSQITYGYVRHVKSKTMLHRMIIDAEDGEIVDHINRNPLDNRRENLRIVTQAQNVINKGKQSNNTSGHTGVDYDKRTKSWKVRINIGKKMIWLGRHKQLEDAVNARKEAEKVYFGEYAPF